MSKAIRYRRGRRHITVKVEDPGPVCAACLREFQGRRRNTHHWREEYTFEQVKENPGLALENSVQVCVPHHHVANAIREIIDWLKGGHITVEEIRRLVRTMPEDMQAAWRTVCWRHGFPET